MIKALPSRVPPPATAAMAYMATDLAAQPRAAAGAAGPPSFDEGDADDLPPT